MDENRTPEPGTADDERFAGKTIPGMFDGPVLPLIARLSAPIFAGMLFQILYNITDTIWISRIDLADPSYVGGTGIVFPIIFLAIALSQGIVVGISSLVARGIGEKNLGVLNRAAESGLLLAVIFSAFFIVFGYLFDDLLIDLLGASGDYRVHALEYFRYILPAAVLMFVGGVFNGILQGEGLMKYVMKGMIIGTVGNIVLDPVFIFLLDMKVPGAAIATVIAQGIAVLYVVGVFLRKKTMVPVTWRLRDAHGPTIGRIAAVGLPAALGQTVMSLSFLFLNRIVVSIDPLALTAFSICGRFDQVVFMPIFAVGSALITMIGQNAGRKRYDRVREIWRQAVVVSLLIVLILATMMILLAPVIYPFFSSVDEVIRYAVLQTRIMEYTFLLAVIGILGRSVFQAIGHPLPALMLTLLRLVIIALPAVYVFVYVFDMGIYGVWFGLMTGNATTAVVGLFWIRSALGRLEAGTLRLAKTG